MVKCGHRKPKKFHVEFHHEKLGWRNVLFTERSRQYCTGYVDAMDSLYPSRPYRVVATYADGSIAVVHKTFGRGEVHTN